MARTSKVDTCIFCSDTPCSCNKPKKVSPQTRSKPQAQPVVEEVTPAPKTDMRAAMRANAAQIPQVIKERPSFKPIKPIYVQPETSIDDLMFADALRNLAPILHPDEIEKYRVLITSQPSTTDRARIWKARRNG